ncbi:MAG: imidazole glycerol phosphate synthase subunit HisH, partial [Actinomycetota bacterium]
MIAILDYGSGNIRSAQRALERVGSQVEVTSQYEVAL